MAGEPRDMTGEPAPSFTLPDADSRLVSLAEFRGCIVFLDFFRHVY